MNITDFIVLLILFAVGLVCGIIGTAFMGTFFHFLINRFLEDSIFRLTISLFLILVVSFLFSMIGLVGILGFAADESAGEIVPYYLTISVLVSLINTIGYYFIKLK